MPYLFYTVLAMTTNKLKDRKMTKEVKTMYELTDGELYQRDHKLAFKNAKVKGLKNPHEYMYMYSSFNKDFFKNINFRNYISFEQ